jgi:hypothetical protein
VTGWQRIGGEGEDMGREWMRRGRKSSGVGEQWIVAKEKGRSEGGKDRDKKIVMVTFVIQKQKKEKTPDTAK